MRQKNTVSSLYTCINSLYRKEIIAYPTEAVFALGCDPEDQMAVTKLLSIKKRSIDKGLILISSNYSQLQPYVEEKKISSIKYNYMFSFWPGPFTFIVPPSPQTPHWLTGRFNSIAIRITDHPDVKSICNIFGKPLISTSANLSGQPPCRTIAQVSEVFGKQIAIFQGETSGFKNTSTIYNIITEKFIRKW